MVDSVKAPFSGAGPVIRRVAWAFLKSTLLLSVFLMIGMSISYYVIIEVA